MSAVAPAPCIGTAWAPRTSRAAFEHARLVEPFRRADWNDFTMGLVRGGIPRGVREAAEAELPVRAFIPKAILRLTLGWLRRHPLRPAPMFRGRAALRRSGRG